MGASGEHLAMRDTAMRRAAITVRGRDDSRCPVTLRRQIDRLIGVSRIEPAVMQSEAA